MLDHALSCDVHRLPDNWVHGTWCPSHPVHAPADAALQRRRFVRVLTHPHRPYVSTTILPTHTSPYNSPTLRAATFTVSFIHKVWSTAQNIPCIHKGNCPTSWATAQRPKILVVECINVIVMLQLGQLPIYNRQLTIIQRQLPISVINTSPNSAGLKPALCR